MLKTLRNRLILSHALPLLIMVPLIGIVLISALESRYLIPNLTRNLENDAKIIADVTGGHPEIWTDPRLAQDLVDRLSSGQVERILLLTREGYLLASSDIAAQAQTDIPFSPAELDRLAQGQVIATAHGNPRQAGEEIEVAAPVVDANGELVGIVWMTYQYETFYQELVSLRYLIGAILLAGLAIGVTLGLVLALNLERPVEQVTQAVYELASGGRREPLVERGPEEVRQLQRAANYLVEQLQSLEESRRILLANLVHELGRPLGALRAAVQALLRGAKNDPGLMDELLAGMDAEAQRLQGLTEELADLHDLVMGHLELKCERVDLGDWLSRLVRPYQEAAAEKRLQWSVDIPAELPVVDADPDRLAQVIGNLLSNAIKYTPGDGEVSVSAGRNDREVWICVRDSGPGILPEEQEKVFSPFFRGNQGRRFPQGMGLGLSIAHDLAAAHHGHIELDSLPGQGSSFTLWLPVTVEDKALIPS